MARIPIEKKSSGGGWGWILGLLALALIVWGVWEAFDNDETSTTGIAGVQDQQLDQEPGVQDEAGLAGAETQEPGAVGDTTEGAVAGAEGGALPVADILQDPERFSGQEVSGEAEVSTVPTDRGFWIERDGERLLVVMQDQPSEVPIDVNPGQRLQVDGATVYSNVDDLPGQIDQDTRDMLRGQPVFLSADESDIQVLGG